MFGLTDYSVYMVVVLAGGLLLLLVGLHLYGAEADPLGFTYNLWRSLWYDLTYYFFGPRIGEV
jgi:hypothetical protein